MVRTLKNSPKIKMETYLLYLPGEERTVLGALGDERVLADMNLHNHPHVDEVKAILSPYKKVSRELHPEDTIVEVGPCRFSPDKFVVIGGPCAVESTEQMGTVAQGPPDRVG